MTLLVLGVALFLGVHLVPSTGLRGRLVERIGMGRYKGLFSVVALIGLVLIIIGKGRAPMVPLWDPPSWGFTAAVLGMPLALMLFIASSSPTNIKRVTRHPMLWGVTLWAGLHLLSNGDLASLILFGSFGAFALFDMWSANRRGASLSTEKKPLWGDVLVVVVGFAAYGLFLYFHESLFGRTVLPYWHALWS